MPMGLSALVTSRMGFGLLALGAVALGGAGTTCVVMHSQANHVAALTRAADGPALVEGVRAEAYAIIMESRGLYLARNAAQAAGFASNLRGHLTELQADWVRLHDVLPPGEQARAAALDDTMTRFVSLRTQLATVGVTQGAKAADALGNSDVNRDSLEAFSRSLDELAAATALTVRQLGTETVITGRRTTVTFVAASSIAVITTFGAIFWLLRRLAPQPLRRLTTALTAMAASRLSRVTLRPPGWDEVGGITGAARAFLEKLLHNRGREDAAEARRIASDRKTIALSHDVQDFGASISGVMASLEQSASQMDQAAVAMAEAANLARQTPSNALATSHVADGVATSAHELDAVAAAARQMAASVNEISRQIAYVTTAVARAVDRACETDKRVAALADVADRIGDVVRLLTAIGGQTNLLATNATVEAPRAGDAGKAFSVVASAVKTLTNQTGKATDQLFAHVRAIRTSTGEAVDDLREVSLAIGQVATVATAIAAAVEQQAAATQAISANARMVTRATNAATQALEQVLNLAEQTDSASGSVPAAAGEHSRTAGLLLAEADDFPDAVNRDQMEDQQSHVGLPGNGATAALTIRDVGTEHAVVETISHGGVALICHRTVPAGTEAAVILPSVGFVSGRVVRSEAGLVTIAFRQDAATLALLDRALKALTRGTWSAAA